MSTAPAMPEVQFQRGTRMPMEEYLRTLFHPDREYVEGVAEERIESEWDHGRLQGWFHSSLQRKASGTSLLHLKYACRLGRIASGYQT